MNFSAVDITVWRCRRSSQIPGSRLLAAPLAVLVDDDSGDNDHALCHHAGKAGEQASAALISGHTGEGAELAFGLTVNGTATPEHLWRKIGLQPGDAPVLTKPLGTGTLFTADMRGKAPGAWIDGTLASMLQSNQSAAETLRHHGVRACTDITAFGGKPMRKSSRRCFGKRRISSITSDSRSPKRRRKDKR